jgi:hypothetical protein
MTKRFQVSNVVQRVNSYRTSDIVRGGQRPSQEIMVRFSGDVVGLDRVWVLRARLYRQLAQRWGRRERECC